MVTNATHTAYTQTARGLHWLAALLVAMLFGVGLYMTRLEFSDWKVRVYAWHEWTGLVVFVLTGVRLAWRRFHPAPPLPPSAWIEQAAASATHAILYALMFVLPILGFLGTNAFGFKVVWFGLVELPDPIGKNEALGRVLLATHAWLAYAMMALAAIHIGAALYHHFGRRDGILRRMLPGLAPRGDQ